MRKHRRLATLLWGDFRLWITAPRTLWMIGLMLLLCTLHVRSGWQWLGEQRFHAGETIAYFFYDGFHLMMSSSIFLLGCSEMPKRTAWQQFSLIRSNRRSWFLAYLSQCLLMVCMTIAMMMLATLLLSIGHISPGTGWSDLERIARLEILPSDSVMPLFLLENATPLQGVVMCLAPLMLFWFSMLLVILLFGMTSKPQAGLLICAFAVLSYVCIMDESNWWGALSLFRYTALSGMMLEYRGIDYFWKVIAGYGILDASLMLMMAFAVRRMDAARLSAGRG